MAGESSCRFGSEGPLCELCSDGFILDTLSDTCERCKDAFKNSSIIIHAILISIVITLGIATFAVYVKKRVMFSAFYAEHEERLKNIGSKLTAFLVTMQIIILMSNNHAALDGANPLPRPFKTFLTFFDFLALDVMNVLPIACIFSKRVGQLESLLAWTIIPDSLLVVTLAYLYFPVGRRATPVDLNRSSLTRTSMSRKRVRWQL